MMLTFRQTINRRLQELKQSLAVRSVLPLMIATGISQLVTLGTLPLLTRMYTPDAFGIFRFFLVVVGLLSVIAAGRYELAIVLAKNKGDAFGLLCLSFIVLAISISLLFLIIILGSQITYLLKYLKMVPVFYFVPLGVFLGTGFYIFYYWFNRESSYRSMAVGVVTLSVGTAIGSLAAGLYSGLSSGLVLGSLFGQFIGFATLYILYRQGALCQNIGFNRSKILMVARKYVNHPKHLVVAHSISAICLTLPVFFISFFYGLDVLGQYALVVRILGAPVSLIATSVGDVLRQKFSEEFRKDGRFNHSFVFVFTHLLLLAMPCFIIFFVVAPRLIPFVFGSAWQAAGEYSRILCISTFAYFVTSPLDKAALATGHTNYIFLWYSTKLLSYITLAFLSYAFAWSFWVFLWSMCLIDITSYIVDLAMGYRFSKGRLQSPQSI